MCTAGTAAGIADFVIQRKCDCAYRRKRRQFAIGTTLEIAFLEVARNQVLFVFEDP
jgi:hypothetical protein